MSSLEAGLGRLQVRGGGGRVQRGGRGAGRIQGGWGGAARGGSGVSRGRGGGGGGGGWNRFPEDSDGGHSHSSLKYRPSEEGPGGRRGLRPEEEMLEQVNREKKKNTESFKPSHEPSELRVMFSSGVSKYTREIQTRDVIFVPDIFCSPGDLTIYHQLHAELKDSGLTSHQIWSSWHGDSHLIANDKTEWAKHCPTFHFVLDKIRDYFNMEIAATRLNWYRDSSEWKPFHHDAAAIKEEKARQSNLTVAVSFGLEREAAFEHAKTKTIVSMPAPNGSAYVFARDINVLWRHGILQVNPDNKIDQGRVSVIAWGWTEQRDV